MVLSLVAAHIPLYLYPFLNTVSKTRPFEYLRLTSLGVIGALVKVITSIASRSEPEWKLNVQAPYRSAQSVYLFF